jgi:hypothetical protein
MRAVEDPTVTEEPDTDSGTFTCRDLGPQLPKQRLNVTPLNVTGGGTGKDRLKRSPVFAFHGISPPRRAERAI